MVAKRYVKSVTWWTNNLSDLKKCEDFEEAYSGGTFSPLEAGI